MTIETAIEALRRDAAFLRNTTGWHRLPAVAARTSPFPSDLDARLGDAVRRLGVESLYVHQSMAWRAARAGQHFVVVTPTASGKSLCYNLPVLHELLDDPQARALYLFPTKALAQDQLAELAKLKEAIWAAEAFMPHGKREHHSLTPSTYDGDTPRRERSRIRRQSRILLTNPDMLHTGILPHHPSWAEFFSGLRYVVIDELHAYRGVFGSHCANVLRRLRRICRFYGSDPHFFCASATIANPQQLAERLVDGPVTLIDDDGSPKGERHFVFYNPPLVDQELGLRRSSTLEAETIAGRLLGHGVQTIVFTRARLTVEVLLTYLRERVCEPASQRTSESAPQPSAIGHSPSAIRGYRGGYLPDERRQIEQGLREGSVRAVVATNALELGVNIGGLDAAILTGFPGTIASTWQQAGRAGRRGEVSLAILVATAGTLDQYVINHPQYLLGRSPEHALINPDNLIILSSHVACAAFELPFRAGEMFGGVEFTEDVLAFLEETGEVQRHGGDWFWMGESYPAQAISLRTASPDNVVIHGTSPGGEGRGTRVIGELEREAAPLLLHEGAIYMHEGESFLVERLDWHGGQAWVVPADVAYYTQASTSQQVRVLAVQEQEESGGVVRAYGPVEVISRAAAYRKVKLHTHETLGYGEIDLPDQVLETDAYWMAFSEEMLGPLRASGQWRSDPNDYGPNWQQQRQAARARDGYRCTVCGSPEVRGRQHDVHHRLPFRTFGYVPGLNENYREGNRLDNLVTLCRSCHLRVEQGQRVRTGLGGLAHVLGDVAPLHLMCDARDIGVVSEARAPESGLPTITVYEKVPAGIGFSRRLFEQHQGLLRAAREVVSLCQCQSGCPACVGPLPEETQIDVDAKSLTIALIDASLAADRDCATSPGGARGVPPRPTLSHNR